MLKIKVPVQAEQWDEEKEEFVPADYRTLQLEHSLVSLSKWESKWCKPFLSRKEKTQEETIDYIKCMTINQNVPPEVYEYLTSSNIQEIDRYINAPMSAAVFPDEKKKGNPGKFFTAETLYYWMITLNIPFECQKWHLNRLIALVKYCNAENAPKKKKSMSDIMSDNARMNEERRKKYNTTG